MSKKRKVLGSYFNLDLTQKLNFEKAGEDTLKKKNNFSNLDLHEIAKSRRLNRLRMITRKHIEINKIIRKIMG